MNDGFPDITENAAEIAAENDNDSIVLPDTLPIADVIGNTGTQFNDDGDGTYQALEYRNKGFFTQSTFSVLRPFCVFSYVFCYFYCPTTGKFCSELLWKYFEIK